MEYISEVGIKLVKERKLYSKDKIDCPEAAVRVLSELLKECDRETVYVINLSGSMTPINVNCVSVGSLNSSLIHPREVLKSAILSNAAHIILLHVHPSGNPVPSRDDIAVTDRLVNVCAYMGIPLVDHIIVGDTFFSFKENSLLKEVNFVYAKSVSEINFASVLEV